MDSRKFPNNLIDQQMTFFRKHSVVLTGLIIVLSLITSILILNLSEEILIFGLLGSTGVVLYLVLNSIQPIIRVYFFPREIFIAALYLYGTLGVPWIYRMHPIGIWPLHATGIFLLILGNVLFFNLLDYQKDLRTGCKSMAVVWSSKLVYSMGIVIVLTAVFIYLCLLFQIPGMLFTSLTGLIMSALLLLLFLIKDRIPDSNNGGIADSILLLPVLLLFIEKVC
jgi:4-hydroxybenzoate polyprenyltransferase